jgi:CRISPR/Cas system-associated protein endoribonuclease Cas2
MSTHTQKMKTESERKSYAQKRANETGKPYLMTEFSVLSDCHMSRAVLRKLEEPILWVFKPARDRIRELQLASK